MAVIDHASLPYRPCAGILLLNAQGMIWQGRRFDDLVTDEIVHRWQMPQGGIDDDEDSRAAAFRELYEETGIRSAEIVREARDWIYYDLPVEALGIALKGKYRGQRQKWFAMRFLGDEGEIDLNAHAGNAEFDAWRWATPAEVMDEIVEFKRDAYLAVLSEFRDLIAAA